MIVIDASAVLSVLLRTPVATALESRLFGAEEVLHAPHLIDVEVAQALRRYVRSGTILESHGAAVLESWRMFPVARHGHDLLLTRIWALRDAATAYDAAYLALAETLGATLVTGDAKMARAHGHGAKIELFEEPRF